MKKGASARTAGRDGCMERMVEFAGRNYCLRYTVNSMCAVEERAGRPISGVLDREYSATRLLLWGGLIDAQKELTLEEAGELIGAHLRAGGTLDEVVDLCAAAMKEAGFFGPEAQTAEEKAAVCARRMQR